MEKVLLYQMDSLYRDSFKIYGYHFGGNEKTVCIVGAIRGNEIQQLYMCSNLIKTLKLLEERRCLDENLGIMIVPSVNPYSLNTSTRFWATDNTDINRMFPGYDLGETTQRIADGFFQKVKDYTYGIHFTSFYLEGNFTPHVRIMKTGYENVEVAKEFAMPHIMLRNPKPYDTTTLNYEWQVWGTQAFSIYTPETDQVDVKQARYGIDAVIKSPCEGCLFYHGSNPLIYSNTAIAKIIKDTDFI